MWQKPVKKMLYLLNIGNFAPEVTTLTYPLIFKYAEKIEADIHVITERKFPDYPVTYEKLQIFELAQQHNNDWNIYLDSDALVHPDMFDITNHLSKDTVMHNGKDMASNRWTYDRFFLRDGRNIGSCNWFTVASDWCIELWKPIVDLTCEQMIKNIHPVNSEITTIITPDHLIDDYVLSRNIAQYGLKFTTFIDMLIALGQPGGAYFWHVYTISIEKKVEEIKAKMLEWKLA